jgi:hypothetical protein
LQYVDDLIETSGSADLHFTHFPAIVRCLRCGNALSESAYLLLFKSSPFLISAMNGLYELSTLLHIFTPTETRSDHKYKITKKRSKKSAEEKIEEKKQERNVIDAIKVTEIISNSPRGKVSTSNCTNAPFMVSETRVNVWRL